jgi:cell division transport system permease protein
VTLLQALAYFFVEAGRGLLRAWRASTIAILTIALSIYVGSFVLLVTGNLTRATSEWKQELRVTVYLEEGTTEPERLAIEAALTRPEWIGESKRVSSQAAGRRFAESFPRLSDLAASGDLALPESLEATLLASPPENELSLWKAELAELPGVELVDDDRQWLTSLSRLVGATRTLGLVVGFGLLIAAAFTIASVVKLTAYLFLEEITVLRLVGATEFFIRGPFYTTGLLQGLVGGLIALGVLWVTRWSIASRAADAFWQPLLIGDFLSPAAQVGLVALAASAGFAGAFVSLRKERLDTRSE